MRFCLALIFSIFAMFAISCSRDTKPATPYETFATYTKAINKKDTTTMKLLLSQETLKMHEQEAKAKNETVDDVVKRETLFGENQTTAEFRNEKTEDDKATIEMKDSMGIWNTVQFVKEDGIWKIDRRSFANQIEQEVEQKNNELDDIINKGRQP